MLTERLAERLKAVAHNAQHLSPEAQDRLAEQIGTALVSALWAAQVKDLHLQELQRAVAGEARRPLDPPPPSPRDSKQADPVDVDNFTLLFEDE